MYNIATGMINHPWQSIIWNSISGIWFKNIDWLLSIAIGQSIMMITSIITSKRKLIAIECYWSTMIDKYSTHQFHSSCWRICQDKFEISKLT